MVDLPPVPDRCNWLNPVVGQDYVRDVWLVIRAVPAGTQVLARVVRSVAGQFVVEVDGEVMGGDAEEVFNTAAQAAWRPT